MENNLNKAWSVWIDYDKKIISVKENPTAKQVFFESQEIGMQKVTELFSKGYKIG